MVLIYIAEVSLWGISKIFNGARWLIWGNPRSREEILLHRQQQQIELMQSQITYLVREQRRLNQEPDVITF